MKWVEEYAFKRGEPKRLKLEIHRIRGSYYKIIVSIDGKVVKKFQESEEKPPYFTLNLENGSMLEIDRRGEGDIKVSVNGRPLPESVGDLIWQMRSGSGMGGIGAILAAITNFISFHGDKLMAAEVNSILSLRLSLGSVVIGIFYLVLAYFVMKKSKIGSIALITFSSIDLLITGLIFPWLAYDFLEARFVAATFPLSEGIVTLYYLQRLKDFRKKLGENF